MVLVIDMVSVVGGGAQLVLAGVLGYAALGKAVPHHSLQPTMSALGLPARPARLLAYVTVGAEAGAALTLLVAPGRWWVYAMVAALAGGFAVAGATALLTGRDVPCRCLGLERDSRLGWRQILLLPLWLAGCLLADWWAPRWSAQVGLLLATALAAGVGVRYVARLGRLKRQLRWDRQATPA